MFHLASYHTIPARWSSLVSSSFLAHSAHSSPQRILDISYHTILLSGWSSLARSPPPPPTSPTHSGSHPIIVGISYDTASGAGSARVPAPPQPPPPASPVHTELTVVISHSWWGWSFSCTTPRPRPLRFKSNHLLSSPSAAGAGSSCPRSRPCPAGLAALSSCCSPGVAVALGP